MTILGNQAVAILVTHVRDIENGHRICRLDNKPRASLKADKCLARAQNRKRALEALQIEKIAGRHASLLGEPPCPVKHPAEKETGMSVNSIDLDPLSVLEFWWQAGPNKWFARDDAFDHQIRDRFLSHMDAAKAGDLDTWLDTPHGALALIILTDQFPRNVYRNDPRAFAADPKACDVADIALSRSFDLAFPKSVRVFFYLPYEHAEDIDLQEKAVDLCRRTGEQTYYHYALLHMDVIRRFGRFPHRNTVLGRETTAAEAAYLADRGFSA